ncbi:MAG TPA: YqaJ viral recombinase family protein [Gaiellaceae bacterium]|nr:YqaJ viral recombinase family protein [Gaiellaceae bacterium]
MRRTGITATDAVALAAAAAGDGSIRAYGRTPHDVFTSKVLGVDDFHETEATELGQELEPIVIARVARRKGVHALRVDPEKLTRRHPTIAHHIATPDALFAQTAVHEPHALGQVKVCGFHDAMHWGKDDTGADSIPVSVLIQVTWEFHVSPEIHQEYVGVLVGTGVKTYTILRDPSIDDLEESLVDMVDQFWTDHVVPKKPPPPDGTPGARRMLGALFPAARAGSGLKSSPEAERFAESYFYHARIEKEASAQKEIAQQGLISILGDTETMVGDGWRLRYPNRAPVEVPAYVRKGYRHFDLRATKGPR